VIPDILQLPDLRGQAGLHARSEVRIGPHWCVALQHSYRGRVGVAPISQPLMMVGKLFDNLYPSIAPNSPKRVQ
jgi:hypothetical protein